MRLPREAANAGQIIRLVVLWFAIMYVFDATDAAITFTPGHIYSTYTSNENGGDPGFRNIIEYDATGTVLGSLVIPSLIPGGDELNGLAFGPDGFLYAVVQSSTPGFRVLVLDSSGAVHSTYTNSSVYFGSKKIAVDPQYIYVAGGNDLVRFTVGSPNSGVLIYSSRDGSGEMSDVKILPNGHLFVASRFQIDEITNTGTVVRTVASRTGNDLVNIKGIEYDPVINKLFVADLGPLDGTRTLFRLNASTGAIETVAFFFYPTDLFLTESRNLVVGARFDTPRVYNENLAFVRTIGTAQRMFVTQYRPAPKRAAVADFNSDGHPDYVLQNTNTRQTAIWYLNNNVYVNGVYGPTIVAGWALRGLADFNGDSHSDYALLAPNTNQTALWYLSGPTYIAGAYAPTLPGGWELVATADFNGNSKPDYVLYNGATRQTAIWYLNNNVYIGGAYGPTLQPGWNVAGVADFDRDSHPDYVLFHPSTGYTAIWYLSGPTLVGGAWGPTIPSGWTLVATADFNGDGKSDYMLYNAGTRQTAIWYLNNNVYVAGVFGPTIPIGWSLAAP